MAKYSKKLTDVICELIVKDMSITEVCEAVGINRKTFYEWMNTKPEFAKAIEYAREQAYEELLALARRTLRERLEGYTIEETTYTYEPASFDENEMILKKKVVKRKRKEPSLTSLNNMIRRTEIADKKAAMGTNTIASNVAERKDGLIAPSNSKEALILADFFMRLENKSSITEGIEQEKNCSNMLLFNKRLNNLPELQSESAI